MIKNCTCYYFNDIIKIEDFYFNTILINTILRVAKSYENVLVYNISCKILIGAKLGLCIRFGKVRGFIRVYDRTRYSALFEHGKYHTIFNMIKYLMGVRNGITYVISHIYEKIKVDLYNSLPLEETLTLHHVAILIKSVFNKDKDNYYHNIFF